MAKKIRASLRRQVVDRARGCCEYCQSQERFSTHAFSVEHIEPRSAGGLTTDDNLALGWQGCNNHKYNRTRGRDSATGATVPLFHPRRDNWNEHFAWNHDFSEIIGITPSGRATVVMLRLNRPGLIAMRRILFEAGEHPPVFPK